MCPAPAIHNAHGGETVSRYSHGPEDKSWNRGIGESKRAIEKSLSTPQDNVCIRLASSLQNSSPCLCAFGKITPKTFPPQINPSSQPKSWSRSKSKLSGSPERKD